MDHLPSPLVVRASGVFSLSDDELLRLCAANGDLRIERDADGNLIFMSPSGSFTSSRNSRIVIELGKWNDETGLGIVFDSNGGFSLPNGAMRAPDAAWIPRERWQQFSREEQEKFLPLCPDFVVELCSPTDRRAAAREKMEEWMANGCRLGWLIDPATETAEIYRADGHHERIETFDATLSGEDVLPGFELDLRRLR